MKESPNKERNRKIAYVLLACVLCACLVKTTPAKRVLASTEMEATATVYNTTTDTTEEYPFSLYITVVQFGDSRYMQVMYCSMDDTYPSDSVITSAVVLVASTQGNTYVNYPISFDTPEGGTSDFEVIYSDYIPSYSRMIAITWKSETDDDPNARSSRTLSLSVDATYTATPTPSVTPTPTDVPEESGVDETITIYAGETETYSESVYGTNISVYSDGNYITFTNNGYSISIYSQASALSAYKMYTVAGGDYVRFALVEGNAVYATQSSWAPMIRIINGGGGTITPTNPPTSTPTPIITPTSAPASENDVKWRFGNDYIKFYCPSGFTGTDVIVYEADGTKATYSVALVSGSWYYLTDYCIIPEGTYKKSFLVQVVGEYNVEDDDGNISTSARMYTCPQWVTLYNSSVTPTPNPTATTTPRPDGYIESNDTAEFFGAFMDIMDIKLTFPWVDGTEFTFSPLLIVLACFILGTLLGLLKRRGD